ncbi:hypothetical protein [Cobetia crustatorum]|uniref:Uncharacterized protein n=1 Tax=Cobetia crustatorum TaxID=553385 RepID=A0A558HRW4_9GAMM|nr:hypothetical protein [Cobetia crustatorum]TVU71876.1 hypothetical protein FQP86_04930 [Cobetia crustatorum]
MSRSYALPFLTLSDDVVGFDQWLIGDPGDPLFPISMQLEAWDYARDLQLDARLDLDFEAAVKALGVPDGENLKLAIVVNIGTGSGRFARRMQSAFKKVIEAPIEEPLIISLPVGSCNLSGRLLVRLEILLAEDIATDNPLTPRIAGSRLWSDTSNVHLEDGGDARFPMEVLSFKQAFQGQRQVDSPWYLHMRPGSPEADFTGSVRLYVNADHEIFAERVSKGDPVTLQTMLGDVMIQMCRSALEDEEARDTLNDCEEGSVGSQITGWLELAFPNMSIEDIHGLMTATPSAFHASLLSTADMGDTE